MNNTHTKEQQMTTTTTVEQTLLQKSRKGAAFDNHSILMACKVPQTAEQLAEQLGYSIKGGSFKRRLNWLTTKDRSLFYNAQEGTYVLWSWELRKLAKQL